ncbi:MAG: amidohydrolase, partial [Actinobacteria bacterium]|nr:amidohydrolase [Actinomycetota bacterium]
MIRWNRSWPDLPEDLPVDVLPASNGEFSPRPASKAEKDIMALANEKTEELRRSFGMSRRDFVRTAAAMTVGFWAINTVRGGRFGYYANADLGDPYSSITPNASDLNHPGSQLANLPGEFIFDVQSHHVESDGMWRLTNPGFEAFFAAVWSQAGPLGGTPSVDPATQHVKGFGIGQELDPIENLSRYHYLKELFLDSSTTMTVLSAVPAAPDLTQPLPIDRAAYTVEVVRNLSQSPRSVMHAFVMPNRGSGGSTSAFAGADPVYMQDEFDIMEMRASTFKEILRGWKVYTAWGDVPYASGWFFDDSIGERFLAKVVEISNKNPTMPPNVAVHKGFALPAFDQRAASPRDVGPAARNNPGVNFIIYHSGYDGATQVAYPGDDKVNSSDRDVNSLIKSLRENGLIAHNYAPAWSSFGNVPNVYAEIGSTWRSVYPDPDQAAALMGKLIAHVGPARICWGTDSLWFGSPQSEIVAFRKFNFTEDGIRALCPGLFYDGTVSHTYTDASGKTQTATVVTGGMDADFEVPDKVNALNGAYYNPLSTKFPSSTPPGYPRDGKPHPERTIRNAVFGRNAARVYSDSPAARANPGDPRYNIDPDLWLAKLSLSGGLVGSGANELSGTRDPHVTPRAGYAPDQYDSTPDFDTSRRNDVPASSTGDQSVAHFYR